MTKKEFFRKISQILIPPLAYFFMRLFWYTQKKRYHFITPHLRVQQVYVTWHGGLYAAPQVYTNLKTKRKAAAIVSEHSDGKIVASILNKFNIRPMSGSTNKGASKVLREAFSRLKEGYDILISPDGPKGPRHTMNDGAVAIALKSKLPICVLGFQSSSYWQLNSWDKFVIPKPFAKVDFYIETLSIEGMTLDEAKVFIRSKMLEHTII